MNKFNKNKKLIIYTNSFKFTKKIKKYIPK